MANGQYIGVNGVARKVTAPYIGVNGVARNVTAGYIGVNGVARLFFTPDGGDIVLEVEKVTSDTYANSTTYTAEEFILLDIYPKTYGTVNVSYGGLTKTITDTSGAAEPNAQQVFFGTFNGVSDSVSTPSSGELTIDGDCYAFGISRYTKSSKDVLSPCCLCVTSIKKFGAITSIPDFAFAQEEIGCDLQGAEIAIPDSVISIGRSAFFNCNLNAITIGKNVKFVGNDAFGEFSANGYVPRLKTVTILATTPPEIVVYSTGNGDYQSPFADIDSGDFAIEEIIVPKGCGEAYKTTVGWSQFAAYIVEAT